MQSMSRLRLGLERDALPLVPLGRHLRQPPAGAVRVQPNDGGAAVATTN